MANLLNCLICSSTVISDDGDENSGHQRSQFQIGLQLFCKLLQISGNYVDKLLSAGRRGHGEDDVGTGPPPCCKECWLAFEQMLRLQQAIELMQVNLMDQVDKLKAALKSSVPSDYEEDPLKIPPDDILGKIRDELVSCVRNSSTPSPLSPDHPPREKRKQSFTKSPKPPDSVLPRKGKEYQPCSVILERLPANLLNSVLSLEVESPAGITIKQELITSPDGHITSSSDPNSDGGRRSLRRSKLKAFEFIQKNSSPQKKFTPSVAIVKDDRCDFNDEDYVPSPEAASPSQSDHDDDDEEEYPWESEAKPIPELLSNQINSSSGGTGRVSKFSLISPDTLLYQYTLIKVSQGYTHFTCQEPHCPSPHFSDSLLNWNSLFSQIADHIQSTHSTSHSDFYLNEDAKLHQKCPLCPKKFPAGPQFRAHLIGTGRKQKGHRIETVVCETCWKPIRNLADAYRCHQWYHKNDQEKKESPEGLPPTLLFKANKKLRKCGKLMENKKFNPKVTSKLQKIVKIKISDLKENMPFPGAPSPIQDNYDANYDDNDEDGYPGQPEAKPVPEKLPNQTNSNIGTGRMSKFSLISPDTLLYQYTLIKVSQGYTHFTCQEPECTSPHLSDPSLYCNNLFNQIADHIEHVHITPSAKYEPERKCPLCPATFPAGPQFRAHLVGTGRSQTEGHRIETVACESCWKPIRNIADAYRCHQWYHKNEQEKVECPEGLPATLLSRYRRKGDTKMLRKYAKPKVTPMPEREDKQKNKYVEKPIQLKKESGSKKGKDRSLQVRDHFARILEDSREYLLLHQYTLLKATYGVSLTCQESNCGHITNGTDFTAFEEFKSHVKNVHATKKCETIWKCPLCSLKLKTAASFRRHLIYKCSKAMSSRSNLQFICTVCWRPINEGFTLQNHQWLHKSESEKESMLSSDVGIPPKLVKKVKEKERQSQFKCGHCEREFNSLAHLKLHEATHVPKEERKKYMCHQCPRLFLSPVAVRGHIEREHQKELMRVRTCPICSQQFNWRHGFTFTRHMRSHRNERPFVCDVCGKAFYDGLHLKKHKYKVHEERERSWQCEFCEMNYKERYHLKRHRRNAHPDKVVEEERVAAVKAEEEKVVFGPKIAFPCPFCEKVFPLKSRMKKHWEKSCKNYQL